MNVRQGKELDPNLTRDELQHLLDAHLATLPDSKRIPLVGSLERCSEDRWMDVVRHILWVELNKDAPWYGPKDPREPDPGPMNLNPPFQENLRHLALSPEESEDDVE